MLVEILFVRHRSILESGFSTSGLWISLNPIQEPVTNADCRPTPDTLEAESAT